MEQPALTAAAWAVVWLDDGETLITQQLARPVPAFLLNTKVMGATKNGDQITVEVEGAKDGKKQTVRSFNICYHLSYC